MDSLMSTTHKISFDNKKRDEKWVSSYSLNILRSIMASSGVTSIVITSTYRSEEDQARVMYGNLTPGKSMYGGKGQAVEAVGLAMVEEAKRGCMHGFSPNTGIPTPSLIQASMAKQIHALEGKFGIGCVSRHQLRPSEMNVIDISERLVRPHKSIDDFIKILTASKFIERIGIPKGKKAISTKQFVETQHCIHLEILQPQKNDGIVSILSRTIA
jgi:hypothetical protein